MPGRSFFNNLFRNKISDTRMARENFEENNNFSSKITKNQYSTFLNKCEGYIKQNQYKQSNFETSEKPFFYGKFKKKNTFRGSMYEVPHKYEEKYGYPVLTFFVSEVDGNQEKQNKDVRFVKFAYDVEKEKILLVKEKVEKKEKKEKYKKNEEIFNDL